MMRPVHYRVIVIATIGSILSAKRHSHTLSRTDGRARSVLNTPSTSRSKDHEYHGKVPTFIVVVDGEIPFLFLRTPTTAVASSRTLGKPVQIITIHSLFLRPSRRPYRVIISLRVDFLKKRIFLLGLLILSSGFRRDRSRTLMLSCECTVLHCYRET